MKFSRLIKRSIFTGLLGLVAIGCAIPAYAQSGFPYPNQNATPTTTFQNDLVVTGNMWNCMGFSEGISNPNPYTPFATWLNCAGVIYPQATNVGSLTTGANAIAVPIYANSLYYVGDAIRVRIQAHTATNANAKTVTFNWGTTNVALLSAAASSNQDLYADIEIVKTGTNAQQINVAGWGNGALFSGLSTTSAQSDSANINCGVTIATGTAANDVVITGFTVYGEP